MARDHARILCAIWRDTDFVNLSSGAQRMYMLLLSQPKLTMCGSLDYMPGRWSQLAGDTDEEDVLDALAELHDKNFVVIDEEAGELVIRSFVRHDGFTSSPNLVQAMWKAWSGLFSETLRSAVVHQLPAEAFVPGFGADTVRKGFEAPPEAIELRSREPLPKGSAKGSPKGSGNPSPIPVPVPSPVPEPSSSARNSPDDASVMAVCDVLAEWDLQRRQEEQPLDPVNVPDRWLASTARRRFNMDGATIRALIAADPSKDARGVAEALLNAPEPAKPSPLDATLKAQMKRMKPERCPECNTTSGQDLNDDGLLVICPVCRPQDARWLSVVRDESA